MGAAWSDVFGHPGQGVAAVVRQEGAAPPDQGLGGLPDLKMLDMRSMGTPPRFDGAIEVVGI